MTAQLASTTLMPQLQAPLLAGKEQLEQEFYRQLPQIQPRLVEARQIAALLPAGGVLVEFQRYRSSDASTNQYGPPRYLALLLRPDGTIRAIGLGEAAPIDAAVAEAVAATASVELAPLAPRILHNASHGVCRAEQAAALQRVFPAGGSKCGALRWGA
ncbi:MAG: hypothetical protein ACK550_14170, partial [Synechococcaceae cyanobacterium]